MKIVQINSVCGIGSTGRIAVDISKILTENNIENYIFYGIGKSSYPLSQKTGNIIDLRFHQVITRFFGFHGFSSACVTKKLINQLSEIKPDIVHLHNIHGFYLNINILFEYIKNNNIKTIWTLHDCWAFTGHCAYFDYANCNNWKTECSKCKNLKDYPVSWFFDKSKYQFNKKKEIFTGVKNLTLVTPSIWLKSLVKQSFLKEYPVEVINNGIDLEAFKPTESNLRQKYELQNKFVILGICFTLEGRKGGRYLVELAEKLDENYQLVILGLETREKLPDNIIKLPKTSTPKELAEIYSMADVFVNPTLEDNFPTVNLESLACGTPVITFNTGGSIESVDEKTGLVVEKGDIKGLVDAVLKLNENPINSDECVNKAVGYYSKTDRYNDYIKIYQESS